jgi:hypothetical protein
MKKLLVLLFLGVGITLNAQSTKTYGGVKFPTSVEVGNATLEINGGGIREKYWIDLYAAALYVSKKTDDPGKIIYSNDEQAIHIKIISSSVTRERFIESTTEGFKNAGHGKATDSEIKKFMGFFSDEFKIGDKINLEYIPEKGTVVKKNGTVKGTITGLDFKKCLFAIWLGSKPASADLKQGMLGKN